MTKFWKRWTLLYEMAACKRVCRVGNNGWCLAPSGGRWSPARPKALSQQVPFHTDNHRSVSDIFGDGRDRLKLAE